MVRSMGGILVALVFLTGCKEEQSILESDQMKAVFNAKLVSTMANDLSANPVSEADVNRNSVCIVQAATASEFQILAQDMASDSARSQVIDLVIAISSRQDFKDCLAAS